MTGAGAIAGRTSCVAARTQKQCPLAFYVHCFSHKLKLVIVNVCQVQAIRNTMGVISKAALFCEISGRQPLRLK